MDIVILYDDSDSTSFVGFTENNRQEVNLFYVCQSLETMLMNPQERNSLRCLTFPDLSRMCFHGILLSEILPHCT